MADVVINDEPIPFGIAAKTGRPIAGYSDAIIKNLLRQAPETEAVKLALESRADKACVFGTIGGIKPDKLESAGWGLILPTGVCPDVKAALKPLIDLRQSKANPMRVFEGEEAPYRGESAESWLSRHKVRMEAVNPLRGVPYYILIVAPPEVISFEFQYSLDLFWAVGRLWFDKTEEFERYAESVKHYETNQKVTNTRQIAVFATQHDFDQATQLFTKQVARPMIDGEKEVALPLGRDQGFGLTTYLGKAASKTSLEEILRGSAGGVPSLLFTGTHGMQFEPDDERQFKAQGALVCQDWNGYGSITKDHWFAGSDVPSDAQCLGLIHILFACHGAGCTEFDDFDQLNNQPRRVAQRPLMANLPQALLSHQNGGALAVLAHVERAWAYSFQDQNGGSQIDAFRDVVSRLLLGERIGQATDSFNLRWAALATQLSDKQLDLQRNVQFPLRLLGKLWVARNDARNFVILGDPAVQLRVDDIS